MRNICLSLLLFGLFSSVMFSQGNDTRSKIEQMNQQMASALLAGNPDAMAEVYSDEVISLPSYAPMVKGKAEMLSNMKKDFASGTKVTKAEFTTTDIKEEGNIVIEIGTYDMEMDMANSDKNFSDKGKYVTIWEKKGNDLKVIVETWNTDSNPWKDMGDKEKNKIESNE